MRPKVSEFYNPDVVAVVEAWLKGEDEVVMEGYRWIGHSRRRLHKNAVRGSGGVEVLVKEDLLKHCTVQVLDVSDKDILWLQFRWGRRSRYCTCLSCLLHPSRVIKLQVVRKHCRPW